MADIILWSLLAFFAAFGLVEFIRFAYTDWNSSKDDFHVVVCTQKAKDNIEGAIRNAILTTDSRSIIVLSDTDDSAEICILEKLREKYEYIELMKTDEYIDYLKK